jgi:hypothetical protein
VGQRDVAALVGLSSSVPGRVYVSAADLPGLVADFRARLNDGSGLVVMAVPELPADVEMIRDRALGAAAVVDLVESPEARMRQAAIDSLSAAVGRVGSVLPGMRSGGRA